MSVFKNQYRAIATGLLIISSTTILSSCSPSAIGKGTGKLIGETIAEKANERVDKETDEQYSLSSDYSSDDTLSHSQSFSGLDSSNQRLGHGYSSSDVWVGTPVTFSYTEGYPSITTTYCGTVTKVDSTSYDIKVTTGTLTRIFWRVPPISVVKGC